MIEKIKKHFKNLNNIQKLFYLIITILVLVGHPILLELGLSTPVITLLGVDEQTGFIRIGFILVCFVGVFLFKDKPEKIEKN